MSIVDTVRSIHQRSERGRCTSCRGHFADCLPTQAAVEIERLREEIDNLREVRATFLAAWERAEQQRVEALQRLSTSQAEASAFRRQRDEALEQVDMCEATIGDAADLLRDDIIEDDVAIDALVLDAIKRVMTEREDARRWAAP